MSRMNGILGLVATVACLISVAVLVGAAPAEVLEVAAEAGLSTVRLKLVMAFLIVGVIAWLAHRDAPAQRISRTEPISI
jgi:hypothetical protein